MPAIYSEGIRKEKVMRTQLIRVCDRDLSFETFVKTAYIKFTNEKSPITSYMNPHLVITPTIQGIKLGSSFAKITSNSTHSLQRSKIYLITNNYKKPHLKVTLKT